MALRRVSPDQGSNVRAATARFGAGGPSDRGLPDAEREHGTRRLFTGMERPRAAGEARPWALSASPRRTVGLVVTLWFCLTAGFAEGGGLALFSAGLIYLGVIIVYALSLAEMMATGTPEDPFYQRLVFMGGTATGLVIGGFITMTYLATSFEVVGRPGSRKTAQRYRTSIESCFLRGRIHLVQTPHHSSTVAHMLDALASRLQKTFGRLGASGRISEDDLDAALREVRVALLEADVNFKVVRGFVERVRERAAGQDVLKSITPGQQVIGIVNETLVEILGGDSAELLQPDDGPNKVMVVGAKGSGKTTLVGRLGQKFKAEGGRPLLVSTDFERVAASEQLQALADQVEVPAWIEEQEAPAVEVTKRALAEAQRINATHVVLDTVGAVALDDGTADALAELADAFDPTEVLIVVDAMTGQEAVTLAREFDEAIEGTGIVVTKVDSDTRGGAVLSVREVTGLPIKFITTGERLDALEEFHPDRFASRVLGMGDVVSLVERAKATMGERDAEDVARRIRSGQFDLEDFLQQMEQLEKMGSLGGVLDMIPGAAGMANSMDLDLNEQLMKRSRAIIQSMTPEERSSPDILNGSRRRRIAHGAGMSPADVNRLLNQFKDARKLMRAMTSGKGAGGLMRMLGL